MSGVGTDISKGDVRSGVSSSNIKTKLSVLLEGDVLVNLWDVWGISFNVLVKGFASNILFKNV